ncbi:MAG: hypothetical protein NTX33_19820 [Propionibacteriales bacterium]|nr:hypothetical protein [Propionibacteriales bacterium]
MNTRSTITLAVVLACAACGGTDGDRSEDPVASPPSTTTTADAPFYDNALLESLVALAVEPSPANADALPFAERVRLGLGPDLVVTQPRDALSRTAAWSVDLKAFRGYVGPFNALELISEHADSTGSLTTFQVTNGEHPHCAAPPMPPPADLADQRRLSLQPAEVSIDGCLEWFTVDLFLDDANTITAVTLDLWEP